MSTKPESRLQRRIVQALKAEFGRRLWIKKIHVSEFQGAGIPDLIGCLDGFFVSIEVKRAGKNPSPLQAHELEQIARAGGIALVATSPAQAIELVRSAIAAAKLNSRTLT